MAVISESKDTPQLTIKQDMDTLRATEDLTTELIPDSQNVEDIIDLQGKFEQKIKNAGFTKIILKPENKKIQQIFLRFSSIFFKITEIQLHKSNVLFNTDPVITFILVKSHNDQSPIKHDFQTYSKLYNLCKNSNANKLAYQSPLFDLVTIILATLSPAILKSLGKKPEFRFDIYGFSIKEASPLTDTIQNIQTVKNLGRNFYIASISDISTISNFIDNKHAIYHDLQKQVIEIIVAKKSIPKLIFIRSIVLLGTASVSFLLTLFSYLFWSQIPKFGIITLWIITGLILINFGLYSYEKKILNDINQQYPVWNILSLKSSEMQKISKHFMNKQDTELLLFDNPENLKKRAYHGQERNTTILLHSGHPQNKNIDSNLKLKSNVLKKADEMIPNKKIINKSDLISDFFAN